jgi:hypothetical protein
MGGESASFQLFNPDHFYEGSEQVTVFSKYDYKGEGISSALTFIRGASQGGLSLNLIRSERASL